MRKKKKKARARKGRGRNEKEKTRYRSRRGNDSNSLNPTGEMGELLVAAQVARLRKHLKYKQKEKDEDLHNLAVAKQINK
jgi:hypothetical protein